MCSFVTCVCVCVVSSQDVSHLSDLQCDWRKHGPAQDVPQPAVLQDLLSRRPARWVSDRRHLLCAGTLTSDKYLSLNAFYCVNYEWGISCYRCQPHTLYLIVGIKCYLNHWLCCVSVSGSGNSCVRNYFTWTHTPEWYNATRAGPLGQLHSHCCKINPPKENAC